MSDTPRFLLDTHAWFWLVTGDPRFPAPQVEAVEAGMAADRVRLSQISAWEIALKVANGKIRLRVPVGRWLEECSVGLGWLDLSLPIVVDATTLPGAFHKDPADRFIVATARHHRLTLITVDESILAWAADGHVAVAPLRG